MKKLTLLIALFILTTLLLSGAPKRQHEIKEGSGWGRILNNDRQFKNVNRHPKFVTSNRYEKIHIGNKVCIAKKGEWGLPYRWYNNPLDKSYASLLFYDITELGDTSMQFIEEIYQPIEEGEPTPSHMKMINPTLLYDTNHNLYLYYSDVTGLPDNLRDYLWKWDAENRKWTAKKEIYTKHFGQIPDAKDHHLIPKMDKNNNMWLPNLKMKPKFIKYNVDTEESIVIDLWDTLLTSKKYGDSADLFNKYAYMTPFEMHGFTFINTLYILEETGDIFYIIYLFPDNELNLEGSYGGIFRFNPNDVANDNDVYDFRKILNKKGTNIAIAQYNGEIYVKEFDNSRCINFFKYNPDTKQFEDTKIFYSIINKKQIENIVVDSSGNYIIPMLAQKATYSEEEKCSSAIRKLRYHDKDGNFIKEIDIPFNFQFFNIENVVGNRIYFNSPSLNNIGKYYEEEGEWSGLYWFDGLDAIKSIEEPTEAGLLPDIWIRSISPNPASMRVTANIMYYPPGGVFGSEEFNVGLYNILGQKLIDLTLLGNYSDYNKTFEVTFDIPNSINNGA
ncbi:MAG: hypothetical protein GX238_11870, partial [Epulopiscium sp.]|nr:hypothetical protein [Candidatus Epulonipiscium sp.]